MSKKHFEALAKALKAARYSYPVGMGRSEVQSDADIQAITDVCASFNVNFDRARFLKACGVEV